MNRLCIRLFSRDCQIWHAKKETAIKIMVLLKNSFDKVSLFVYKIQSWIELEHWLFFSKTFNFWENEIYYAKKVQFWYLIIRRHVKFSIFKVSFLKNSFVGVFFYFRNACLRYFIMKNILKFQVSKLLTIFSSNLLK